MRRQGDIEWLLRDEYVSCMRLMRPVTASTLHVVARHVQTSARHEQISARHGQESALGVHGSARHADDSALGVQSSARQEDGLGFGVQSSSRHRKDSAQKNVQDLGTGHQMQVSADAKEHALMEYKQHVHCLYKQVKLQYVYGEGQSQQHFVEVKIR